MEEATTSAPLIHLTSLSPPPPPPLAELEHIRLLGSGTGGTVVLVRHAASGMLYALKKLSGIFDSERRNRVVREIQLLCDARHAGIVRYEGFYQHGMELYLLMEYVDGGSLEGHHIPSELSLAELARQMVKAVHYLHSRRIVHRDIKPANILKNSERQFKITDFGLAKQIDSSHGFCNSADGTIAYLSPERIDLRDFSGYSGYAADIWSLGISLLEIHIGCHPYGSELKQDMAGLMEAICKYEPPQAPPTASAAFKDFISCCLQKDPSKRATAEQLVGHDFLAETSPLQVTVI